jgi:hypothetical protein
VYCIFHHIVSKTKPSEKIGTTQDIHRQTHVLVIRSKPMIDPRRHNHQITLLQPQPHPRVVLAPHIEVTPTAQNVPNLLILMKVLVEESLHLFFVAGEEVGGDFDFVAVLVVALGGDFVHALEVIREVVVGYAEGGEVGWVDGAAGVVGEALVALLVVVKMLVGVTGEVVGGSAYLEVVEPVCFHLGGLVEWM